MRRYLLTLELEDAFYQEYAAQGVGQDALLAQLKLDLEDQLDEYDLPRVLTRMIAAPHQDNLVVVLPKNKGE